MGNCYVGIYYMISMPYMNEMQVNQISSQDKLWLY